MHPWSWPVAVPRLGCRHQPPHPHCPRRLPPLTTTGVLSGSVPTATAFTASWCHAAPRPGALIQPPHPHHPVDVTAHDHRGAIRQRPDRHRVHRAVMATQRLPDWGASSSCHTRTVPSSPPLTMTAVAVRQCPRPPPSTPRRHGHAAAPRPGCSSSSRHTRTVRVVATAHHHRGAVRQRPDRRRVTVSSWPRSGSPTGVPRSAATPAPWCRSCR